jgi:hypothetical protein
MLKGLQRAGERAGITHTNVTFRAFRRSSASHLANQGVSQSHLEHRYGWVVGSKVAARYIAVFSDESDRAILKAYGADVSEADETETLTPVECPRCGRDNPAGEESCGFCSQALSAGAHEETAQRQKNARKAILRLVSEEPELLDTVEKAETLLDVFEEHPEMQVDAERLRRSLDPK